MARRSTTALLGDDGGARARERIGAAVHEARELGPARPALRAARRAAGAGSTASSRTSRPRSRALVEGLDHDPAAVARLEERLSAIFALERRYGDDEAAVIAHGEARPPRSSGCAALDGRARAPSRRGCRRCWPRSPPRRATLSDLRAEAAGRLAEAVSSGPRRARLRRAGFEVALGRRPAGPDEPAVEIDGDALAFDATGVDEVVFRFAPNPGEPARPLARIASGGELSRVALAIKEVLAAAEPRRRSCSTRSTAGSAAGAPTRSGAACGRLARRHQVLCVTHLPQIAAHADAHFRIAKRERDGRTVTEVARARPRGPDRRARPDARRGRRRRGGDRPGRASCSTGRPRGGRRIGGSEPAVPA